MASRSRNLLQPVITFVRLQRSLLGLSQLRHISSTRSCCRHNILYSAVCVERRPVITAPRTKLEQRFSNTLSQIELENSYLSDHEVRMMKEEQTSKKKQEGDDEGKGMEGETETALDLEDKWEAEMKAFKPASRETQADQNDDRQSLERKLDSPLYLLVKQKIEGRDHWVLPQATWEQGETLRQTAERALSSVCGEVKATFLGNAPCAVAKYEPKDEDEESGIKLFFFKAWYREGEVKPNKDMAKDYLWVTKEELSQYCHSGYRKHLKKVVFDL